MDRYNSKAIKINKRIAELEKENERLRIVVKYFQQEGNQSEKDIVENLLKEG